MKEPLLDVRKTFAACCILVYLIASWALIFGLIAKAVRMITSGT